MDIPSAQVRMRTGLFVAGFCSAVQIFATQPLLPELSRIFSASALAVSFTVSAVTIACALSAPWVGSLADSVGRKRVIVSAIFGLSVPMVMAATSSSLSQLIAWRFAQGLFVPAIMAVAFAYVAEEALPGTAGSLTAAFITGNVVGGMSGRFITALIADYVGWRWAFFLLAMATAIGGVVTWLCLPRSRRFVRQRDPLQSFWSMIVHLRNARLLATYFVGFNACFTLVGVFTYANFYLAAEPFRLGLVALGSVFFVYGLGVVITPIAGPLIDRFGYRAALLAAAAVVVAGALLTLVPQTWIVILGLAILSSGIFVAQAAASSHVGLVANVARSSATGLYVCSYYLGGSVGATVLGLLWNYGWTACIVCVVAIQLVSAVITLRFFSSRVAVHAASSPQSLFEDGVPRLREGDFPLLSSATTKY